MNETGKPDYLHNPEISSCIKGRETNCPRNRDCEACMAQHHSNPNSSYTACERKAISEGYQI